jgi:D-alanyl-D-alanine carboxypeptidase
VGRRARSPSSSPATALALVDDGLLSLDDTIGERLADLPEAWSEVTLRQLLNHTSGLPDFIHASTFGDAVAESFGEGQPYPTVLGEQVLELLGLNETSLPDGVDIPEPFIHGSAIENGGAPEDVSNLLAAGWAWASGGVVSTPNDLNDFIRGYVSGAPL